jgi:hypothetical protein
VSELAAVRQRRIIQLGRIEGLMVRLQAEGKETPNLEKVKNAPGMIFSGGGAL